MSAAPNSQNIAATDSPPPSGQLPIFEIDQPEHYGDYLVTSLREINFHLNHLLHQHSVLTVYLDEGHHFFLSTLLAVDAENNAILLDGANDPAMNQRTLAAQRVTLACTIDHIKVQIRLAALTTEEQDGRALLRAPIPVQLLRLQRREYFRIETPRIDPVRCRVLVHSDEPMQVLDLPLYDLSGGGLCLTGAANLARYFSLGELFADCRLEIPGESVLSINLRVREVLQTELPSGEHQARIGCEFIGLPGTRLALIERYITKLERERKVRADGTAG